ncbi:MAG: hypothetical protein K9K65_14415 [Desulfarculaceae bacterium]|nr:hypothetical protein [Desulfarculaceae bacterium]MCF8049225.1 hypothetical protein [Desulfarculaceae bacterium]MCF8065120.1 hypothetical protein [Desulfarculaceae bacterium]MCF8099032.1 hypothetical protein [Desulfarculaceae bacterium]MCF8123268.1 hypothetical protein [Desulfarculaceae bacterium]
MLRRALIRGAAAGLLLLLALAALACATAGTQDPGPDPARVRVLVDLKEDRSLFNQFDDTTPYTSWDWGLYLVHEGRNVPLRPDPPQELKVIRTPRLVRDTVFLAPPGKHTLRLIVHGSVGVRQGWTYWPITTVLVNQTFELELKPGGKTTLRPTLVHSNDRGNLIDPYSVPRGN